jgi:biotin carboxyl carrier protein
VADRQRRKELDRLADEIVPLLMARLGESRLGELEIRTADWRVRVRRSPGAAPAEAAGASTGRARGQRAAHREGRERPSEGARPSSHSSPLAGRVGTPSGNGETAPLEAVGPGRASGDPHGGSEQHDERRRVVARAPAVGYYVPADGLSTGKVVHVDDVLGQVDVLGVRQAVLAPAAGIVSRVLAQAGEAVEYGQELLQIDVIPRADSGSLGQRAADAGPGER